MLPSSAIKYSCSEGRARSRRKRREAHHDECVRVPLQNVRSLLVEPNASAEEAEGRSRHPPERVTTTAVTPRLRSDEIDVDLCWYAMAIERSNARL